MPVGCRERLRNEIQTDWQDSHISTFLTCEKPCLLHELLRELDEWRSSICCIDSPHLHKKSPPLNHGTEYCMDAPNSLYSIVHLLDEQIHLISQHFTHSPGSEIQSLKSSKISRDFTTVKI
jgi:hypothetical protein